MIVWRYCTPLFANIGSDTFTSGIQLEKTKSDSDPLDTERIFCFDSTLIEGRDYENSAQKLVMHKTQFLTLGFRRDVVEICALLGHYAESNRNPLPTFRDRVSVPSSRVKKSKNMGPTRCPKASVKDYHSTLRNTPEERRSQAGSYQK
jgi:hypothetical protein